MSDADNYFSESGARIDAAPTGINIVDDLIGQLAGRAGIRVNKWDNKKFAYPGDSVRTMDSPVGYKVRRGFMRALNPTHEEGAATPAVFDARLYFQFNPSTIQRSVTGRNDIHMAINSTPIDMLTPVNGTSNFTLELLFNREAEVASAVDKTLDLERLRAFDANLSQVAGQIGVLADIFVLDNIIGQGLNQASLETVMQRTQYMQEYGATTDEQTGEVVTPAPTAADAPDLETQLREMFEGNSAYLIPRPVRMIFSDLFMVDGLVTSSTVVFNKFSRLMVPTVATVGLQIQAHYIGFHREKTVLTQNWNKPFEKPTSSGSIGAVDGTITDNTADTDATTRMVQDKMKTGLFQYGIHDGNWVFSDTSDGFSPEDSSADPPILHQNFNLRLVPKEGAADFISTNGLEVFSGVEMKSLEYRDHRGVWNTVMTSGSTEPVQAPTKKDGDNWTTKGIGTGHEIKVQPRSGLYRGDSKRLHYDRRYRMKLHVFYSVKAGGMSNAVRSNFTVVWVVGDGTDRIDINTWNYKHGS